MERRDAESSDALFRLASESVSCIRERVSRIRRSAFSRYAASACRSSTSAFRAARRAWTFLLEWSMPSESFMAFSADLRFMAECFPREEASCRSCFCAPASSCTSEEDSVFRISSSCRAVSFSSRRPGFFSSGMGGSLNSCLLRNGFGGGEPDPPPERRSTSRVLFSD